MRTCCTQAHIRDAQEKTRDVILTGVHCSRMRHSRKIVHQSQCIIQADDTLGSLLNAHVATRLAFGVHEKHRCHSDGCPRLQRVTFKKLPIKSTSFRLTSPVAACYIHRLTPKDCSLSSAPLYANQQSVWQAPGVARASRSELLGLAFRMFMKNPMSF